MPPEDDSALERMQRRLYAPEGAEDTLSRTPLVARQTDIPHGWKAPPPPPAAKPPRQKLPLAVRFLIGAGIFFVVAGLIASYFLFLGGNSVSTDNIAITIDGPVTAAGGDTVSLLITVENHNPVSIQDVMVDADFPEGTRSADDVTQTLTHYTDTLGDLGAGAAMTRTVRAVLFGSENQTVTVPVKVEYRTSNSNAVFVKEKDYTVTLTTSPVSVTATSISQVSAGQTFTVSLSVRSNAAKPLSDIALKAEYPFGFTVASTSIASENGLFDLGTLDPGEETKLTVTGNLSGATSDERIFHWSVGSTASSTNGTISLAYASAETDITLTQPFLAVDLSLNGSTSGTPTIAAGQVVQGIIKWTNTLPAPVLDGQITVALTGSAFDPGSVSTQNGFYQSSNATIRFDRDTNSALSSLQPGDTGTGTFSFNVKSASALAELRNPTIVLTVSASGRRTSESGVADSLTSTLSRTIKIASGLNLSSRLVRTVGAFGNTGPWPPVSGSATTYTVLLSAANDVNSVAGASATMTLPSYVTFTGLTSPADGSITYTDSTRTVHWNIGDMGTGASKQGAFQISFLPSTSQKGSSPALVSPQTITGTDRFTQSTVTASAPGLTTQASTDPAYQKVDGTVQ